MTAMKAIVVLPEERPIAIAEIPKPKLRDGWLLVKVHAVAINPTDWKHIDFAYADGGSKIGSNYAGVVEAVGRNVTGFTKGDRIAGFVHGGNRVDHEDGAFGDYLIAKPSTQMKGPDNLTFEEAATLGVAVVTCVYKGQGLYKSLKLPLPNNPAEDPFPILIHGGSTATRMLGIHYAKASGLTVIATASLSNFDKLKSLGADAIFDYQSPTCGADIRHFTQNKLRHAWDCAGADVAICAAALSDAYPGTYGAINTDNTEVLKTNRQIGEPLHTLGHIAIGEQFVFGDTTFPVTPDEADYAVIFLELSRSLLETGAIKPVSPTVNKMGSGLDGVIKGLDEIRNGRVSGTKLVYTI